MTDMLLQYLISFGWALTGAVSMAVSLSILVKIFSWITPVDEWEELKKGNMAVAVVMAAVLVGGCFRDWTNRNGIICESCYSLRLSLP